MERVIKDNNGTAHNIKSDDIIICGKTGTAQNPHGEDHSIFIAFAPKEDPKTQTITLYRDYAYDENNVMGNTDREDSIKKEMISTATTLIFNKLKASAKKYTN